MDSNKPNGPFRFVNYITRSGEDDKGISRDGIKTLLNHQNFVFNKVIGIVVDKQKIYTCCDNSKDRQYVDFKLSPSISSKISYTYCYLRTDSNGYTIRERLPFIDVSDRCIKEFQNGYKALKHCIKIFNFNGNRFDIPTPGSNEIKIKEFTINGTKITLDGPGITLGKTVPAANVYIYFYDHDPRPMLVCFNNRTYACKDLREYMDKWEDSQDVSDCDCSKDKDGSSQLLPKLYDLSMIFNPVRLCENKTIHKGMTQQEYTIHKYPPGHIKNKITKTEFNCYLMFKHTPFVGVDQGYRLGRIDCDGIDKLKGIDYEKSLQVQSVSIYYYKFDDGLKEPLMFVISTKDQTTSNLYYKLDNKTDKSYTKVESPVKPDDTSEEGSMVEHLDQVMYNLNKTISLVVKEKREYQAKLTNSTTTNKETETTDEVTVECSNCTEKSKINYKCYVHRVMRLSQNMLNTDVVSGLKLYLWSNVTGINSQQEINLYDANKSIPSKPLTLYYTSCKGDVCVYFYGDDDPRPLMVCYNKHAYIPKDLESYDKHWIKAYGITNCDCSGYTIDHKVLSKLDEVCMFLNPVRIDQVRNVTDKFLYTYHLQKFENDDIKIKFTKTEVKCYYQYAFQHEKSDKNYRLGQISFYDKKSVSSILEYNKSKPLKKVSVYFYKHDTGHTEPLLFELDFNGTTTDKEYYKLRRPTGSNLTWEEEHDKDVISRISAGDHNDLEQYLDELRYTFKKIVKIEMKHNNVDSYQLVGRDMSGIPGQYSNIDDEKITVEDCDSCGSKQLPSQGYKCLKHKISNINNGFDYKQIAGVVMTLPGKDGQLDLEIPIYDQSTQGESIKDEPLKLLYNKCMSDIYFFFYIRSNSGSNTLVLSGDSASPTNHTDTDTVPLMFWLNKNWYQPISRKDYFKKWIKVTDLQSKYPFKNIETGQLKNELNKVNFMLNQVDLEKSNLKEYGIPNDSVVNNGKFPTKRICVTRYRGTNEREHLISESDSVDTISTDDKTLYFMAKHTTINRGPIAHICYFDREVHILYTESQIDEGQKISSTLINSKCSSVNVYYHKCDTNFGLPLLLGFIESSNVYTDSENRTNTGQSIPTIFYERINTEIKPMKFKRVVRDGGIFEHVKKLTNELLNNFQKKDISSYKSVGDYVDYVNSIINDTLKIKIAERPFSGKDNTNYEVELISSKVNPEETHKEVQKAVVKVSKPEDLKFKSGKSTKFKCFTHTVESPGGMATKSRAGQMRLYLPKPEDYNTEKLIDVYDSKNSAERDANPIHVSYSSCKPGIQVYFYGQDPRPLLVCYNNNSYRPLDKENYLTKWYLDSQIEKCGDGGSGIVNDTLLKALIEISNFLNPVKLDEFISETLFSISSRYNIASFNGRTVNINLRSQKINYSKFCYNQYIHSPNGGHRLGNLEYKGKCIEEVTDIETPGTCINSLISGSPEYETASEIVVYYYKGDKGHKNPLLIALCTKSDKGKQTSLYYKLQKSSSNETKRYSKRANKPISLTDTGPASPLALELDQIVSNVSESLLVLIDKQSTYSTKLYKSDGIDPSDSQNNFEVKVSGPTNVFFKSYKTKFKCFEHKVSTMEKGLDDVGSLIFFINKNNQITLNNESVVQYTSCKGNVYVYFYADDPRPFLLYFNGNAYKPKNLGETTDHNKQVNVDYTNWERITNIKNCACTESGKPGPNEQLLNTLIEVVGYLNPVQINPNQIPRVTSMSITTQDRPNSEYTLHLYYGTNIKIGILSNVVECFKKYSYYPYGTDGNRNDKFRLGNVIYTSTGGTKPKGTLNYTNHNENKYKPLNSVDVYYYKHDTKYEEPLLVALDFESWVGYGTDKVYYKFKNSNDPGNKVEWIEENDAKSKLLIGASSNFTSYLDELRYGLKKIMKIQLDINSKTDYPLEGVDGSSIISITEDLFSSIGRNKNISVEECKNQMCTKLNKYGYKCFEHKLTNIEDNDHMAIAGLLFFIFSKDDKTFNSISLYINGDEQDPIEKIYYNKCMGNVYVWFYDKDPRPLLLCFNGTGYKPKGVTNYYDWVKINLSIHCSCSDPKISTTTEQLLNQLTSIVGYLNIVQLKSPQFGPGRLNSTFELQKFQGRSIEINVKVEPIKRRTDVISCYSKLVYEHGGSSGHNGGHGFRLGNIEYIGADETIGYIKYTSSEKHKWDPLIKVICYYYKHDNNYKDPLLVELVFKVTSEVGYAKSISNVADWYQLKNLVSSTEPISWQMDPGAKKSMSSDPLSYLDKVRYGLKKVMEIQLNQKSNYQLKLSTNPGDTSGEFQNFQLGGDNQIPVKRGSKYLGLNNSDNYLCYEQKVGNLKDDQHYLIGGIHLLLHKDGPEIPLYNTSTKADVISSQITNLYYNKCMGDLVVYYYKHGPGSTTHTKTYTTQQGDGDTVPLMLKYNNNYYRPISKSEYFNKWEQLSGVTGASDSLITKLNKVNRSLNEVLLNMTKEGGYGIKNNLDHQQHTGKDYYESVDRKFSGKRIDVTVSKVNDTKEQPISTNMCTSTCPADGQATCDTLYLEIKHSTTNKGPIGTIKHGDNDVYVVESSKTRGTSGKENSISQVLLKTNYNFVCVYYHKCDCQYSLPLVLGFGSVSTGSNGMETDTTTTIPAEFYERVDADSNKIKFKKVDKTAGANLKTKETIAEYINQVNYDINYGVRINVEQKPKDEQTSPGIYPVELVKPERTGSDLPKFKHENIQVDTTITVTQPQPLSHSNYKYVTHTISADNGKIWGHYIGHLRLSIPGKTKTEKHDIQLFNKTDEVNTKGDTSTAGTVTLYYNSCTPIIYVYFYGNDPRPLMICYENQVFIPYSFNDYSTKWVKASNLENARYLIPGYDSDEQLVKQMDKIIAFLNQVKLEMKITVSSYVIQEFNGKSIQIYLNKYSNRRFRRSFATKQFCYTKITHSPEKGYTLGNLTFNRNCVHEADQNNKDQCITASYGQNVVVYYYNKDSEHQLPLLVALHNESSGSTCNSYYELQPSTARPDGHKEYKKIEKPITLNENPAGNLEETLDRILHNLTNSLGIVLENKTKTYTANLYESNLPLASVRTSGSVSVGVSSPNPLKINDDQKTGYECYKHGLSKISENIEQIGSLKFYLYSNKPISLNGSSFLNYTTCKGDVCVYFYGEDPRPLLFTFDGSIYRPKTMDKYNNDWEKLSTSGDCDCSVSVTSGEIYGSQNKTLLDALLDVTLFLNPVDLSKTSQTYNIHKFNANEIKIGVTKNGNVKCYCKYTHKPENPGYRLGTVGYNNLNGVAGQKLSELKYINGNGDKLDGAGTDIKYKPLTEVSAYFYKHDTQHKDPLLVELSFNNFDGSNIATNTNPTKKYYKLASLANSSKGTMSWQLDNEAPYKVNLGDGELSTHLDTIRYPLKKNLQIILHSHSGYDLKAASTDTKSRDQLKFEKINNGTTISVQQYGKNGKPTGTAPGHYQCYQHELSEIHDKYHYYIAGVKFTFPGINSTQTQNIETQPYNISETPIDISMYKSSDVEPTQINETFYYNKCMGDVYVFFYQHTSSTIKVPTSLKGMTSVDTVPLMLLFNDKWYRPKSRNEYFTKWFDTTNSNLKEVNKTNYYTGENCQKLGNLLRTVNKDLNQIDIDKTKDDHYGLPSEVQVGSQKVKVSHDFNTSRVIVSIFKGKSGGEEQLSKSESGSGPQIQSSGTTRITEGALYFMVRHATVNFGSIGKLVYENQPVQSESGEPLTVEDKYNYVNVYYHRCDHQYVLPLLIGVGEIIPDTVRYTSDTTSSSLNFIPQEFYERGNVGSTLKFKKVQKDNQHTGQTDQQGERLTEKLLELSKQGQKSDETNQFAQSIGNYVDYINSKINKGVKISIAKKTENDQPHSEVTYPMELISTEGDKSAVMRSNIIVSGPIYVKGQPSDITTRHNKFKCYIHNVVSTGDPSGTPGGIGKDIGQLMLFIPGEKTEELQLKVYENKDLANNATGTTTTDIATTIYFASCDPIVYVYFYGDDPRPLMVVYNNKAYVPYDIKNYSKKWVMASGIDVTCECSISGTTSEGSPVNTSLIKELERLSDLLNPVILEQIEKGDLFTDSSSVSYIVQAFGGKSICIKLSLTPSTEMFCYNRYTFIHMGTNELRTGYHANEGQGFRLGKIYYENDQCIQENLSQTLSNGQKCITANGASEVDVYYYKNDTRFDNPLLVALRNSGQYHPYYELQRDSGTGSNNPKLYQKQDKLITIGASYTGQLFTTLDKILYNISKSLQIVLGEQGPSYEAKLINNNSGETIQASTNGSIRVSVQQCDSCKNHLTTNNYICYEQKITSVTETEIVKVGALKLLLYTNQKEPITLDNPDQPIYYTSCKGNVYVCFYNPNGTSVSTSGQPRYDKVPLLFYFNGQWYRPKSRDEYLDKWNPVTNLNGVNPSSLKTPSDHRSCTKLLNELNIVNSNLNQIDLDHPISRGTSRTTSGITYGLGNPQPPPSLSEFPTDRVQVTVQTNKNYTRIIHRTSNSFTIGPIMYVNKDITTYGITINGTAGGARPTTIKVDEHKNHKQFITGNNHPNTVVAYYSTSDNDHKFPQLIVLLQTDRPITDGQGGDKPIIAKTGTKYGYYVLATDNGGGKYKYEWRTVERPVSFELGKETDFMLLNSIIILIDKRNPYEETDISSAVSSVSSARSPGISNGVNRLENKKIGVDKGCKTHGASFRCVKKYGYELYAHDVSELVKWPMTTKSSITLIGGLRFLIPCSKSDSGYDELNLYQTILTEGSATVERLYHTNSNNKIYVWFYDQDPRPLLLFYNGIGYAPNDENKYFTQWVNANVFNGHGTLRECGCYEGQESVSESENKLLQQLDRVVKFLNRVDLKQVGPADPTSISNNPFTYDVQKFKGSDILIKVKSSTVGDTISGSSRTPFPPNLNTCSILPSTACYKKFEHTPGGMTGSSTNGSGYRLGEITFYRDSGNPIQMDYSRFQSSYKYNPLISVTAFYYDKDINRKDPLLVKLEFKTIGIGVRGSVTNIEKEYYKLVSLGTQPTGSGMEWRKDSGAEVEIAYPQKLVKRLDGIRYSLKKVVRIEIQRNLTTKYNLTGKSSSSPGCVFSPIYFTKQIDVVKYNEPGYDDLERKGYICFQHLITTIPQAEQYQIGGLAMTLPGQNENHPVEISLYSNGTHQKQISQLTYNPCMGDIYVCFYNRGGGASSSSSRGPNGLSSSTDTVPLMLWYNSNWYKPKTRDDYFTKWVQVKLPSQPDVNQCNVIDFDNLVAELDSVNKELNRIDLCKTGENSYGLTPPTGKQLSPEFKTERVKVICQEGPSNQTPTIYKRVAHKTVNGFMIGEIYYGSNDIVPNGVKINCSTKGPESTFITIESNKTHTHFVTSHKPDNVIVYYSMTDSQFKVPQLIILMSTDSVDSQTITSTTGTSYGYYIIATNGTGGDGKFKYEWIQPTDRPPPDPPLKLNDKTESLLFNSIVILVEKRINGRGEGDSGNETYGENDISAALKKAVGSGSLKRSPGLITDDINRLKNKNITLKEATGECSDLKDSGFRVISHDMTSTVNLGINGATAIKLIARLRFLIPTRDGGGQYKVLKLYNDDNDCESGLHWYNPNGDNSDKVCVCFYGGGTDGHGGSPNSIDGDPRPLLLCYDNKGYRATSMDDYDDQNWTNVKSIQNCPCQSSCGKELMTSVLKVSNFLNPVQIEKTTNGSYTIHKFNGQDITIKMTVKQSDGKFCYNKYTHTHNGVTKIGESPKPGQGGNGFRLGNIEYGNQCIQDKSSQCVCITSVLDGQPNTHTSASEVVVYYYKGDNKYRNPLIIALKNSSNGYKPYYEIEKATKDYNEIRKYKKVTDKPIKLEETQGSDLEKALNNIRIHIGTTLSVILDRRLNYQGLLYRAGEKGVAKKEVKNNLFPGTQVNVTEQTMSKKLVKSGYKCYKHNLVEADTEETLIGGLLLQLCDTQDKPIKLYEQCNKTSDTEALEIDPVAYTTCMGDLYVYFYSEDPRPLLLCYNNKAYCANNINEYNDKWCHVSGIESCKCDESRFKAYQNLLNTLYGVSMFLNPVNLNETIKAYQLVKAELDRRKKSGETSQQTSEQVEKLPEHTYHIHEFAGKKIQIKVTATDLQCYRVYTHMPAVSDATIISRGFRLGNIMYGEDNTRGPDQTCLIYPQERRLQSVSVFYYMYDEPHRYPLVLQLDYGFGGELDDYYRVCNVGGGSEGSSASGAGLESPITNGAADNGHSSSNNGVDVNGDSNISHNTQAISKEIAKTIMWAKMKDLSEASSSSSSCDDACPGPPATPEPPLDPPTLKALKDKDAEFVKKAHEIQGKMNALVLGEQPLFGYTYLDLVAELQGLIEQRCYNVRNTFEINYEPKDETTLILATDANCSEDSVREYIIGGVTAGVAGVVGGTYGIYWTVVKLFVGNLVPMF